jgi:choline kinase/phosphatidylglycerophosphate synthase
VIGVILAAGFATRLRSVTRGTPKSLIELEPGVTVLDYIVNAFHEVGINKIYVVTRPDVMHFFKGFRGVNVVAVDVVEGDGNLWTLYQAIRYLREMGVEDDIVLSMSDHVYEVAILKNLVKASRGSQKLYLCLDRLIRGRDAVEGLKIVVSGETIALSGKDIPPYSGIDTGLFYIPKTLFSYIEKVVAEKGGKAALSDLINVLTKENLVGYVDVSGHLWQDIDTPEDVERARKLYWRILARNLVKEGDGIVSRYINRRISTAISIALYKAKIFIHPNIVTLIVFAVGALASALIFLGSNILGAALAILSSILDGVDGEIARLFKAQTRFGTHLDTVLDRVVDTLIMAAMFYQVLLRILTPPVDTLQLIIHTLLFSLAVLGSTYVSYISNVIEDKELVARLRNSFPWTTRDVRLTVLAIATALGFYEAGFMYIAFASWIFIVRAMISLWGKEVKLGKQFSLPRPKWLEPRPLVKPSISVVAEELFLYIALLIVLVYLASMAIDKVWMYQTSRGPHLYTLLWQFIASIEIALTVYFAYNAVKALTKLFSILRDAIVEKLWVTPSVYQRIVKKAIVVVVIALSAHPINLVLAFLGVERDVAEVANYTLLTLILVMLVLIAIDTARAFEHHIMRAIARR